MGNVDPKKKLNDMYNAYLHTTEARDRSMVRIMCRREEYEKHLDEMWRIYTSGNMQQVFAYRKQIDYIKNAGLKVLRSKSTGKHKIVYQNKQGE